MNREDLLEFLARELPKLLIERPEVRYEVIGILTEYFARKDEVHEILTAVRSLIERQEEHSRILQEHSRILQEHTRAIRTLIERQEEHSRILQEHSRILQEHSRTLQEHTQAIRELMEHQRRLTEEVAKMGRTISAIGARWGFMAEDAFRDALKTILEREGLTTKKWRHYDEEGIVFGHPDWVEVDVVVRDDRHILVQITSSATRGDVAALYRTGQLYERLHNVKPHLMLVTFFLDERTKALAEKLGVEVKSGADF